MQQLEYDQGGYIISFFNNLIDAYSAKVHGLPAGPGHPQPRLTSDVATPHISFA